VILALALLLAGQSSESWYDETHLAVARAAGYRKWYNAAGADIAKLKAGDVEAGNHYFENPAGVQVTAELVLRQAGRYDSPGAPEGHLYGAVIGALRHYRRAVREGRYAEHHLALAAHYIGDLSQPLHHIPRDAFNRDRHGANDGIVNENIMEHTERVVEHMCAIDLDAENFERRVAEEVARIANLSRTLAGRLRREDRDMTPDEAYQQLGYSASLLSAVLDALGAQRLP
jgi:hypothetical protein